jgi:cysteine-rich repeat protein
VARSKLDRRIVGVGAAWAAALAACSIDAVTFTPLADGAAGACGDGVVDPALEACDDGNGTNGDGCDRDCTRGPVYVKASNAGMGDIFGSSVALSADGSTMAVGAYNEASDATGIDGDPLNDRALNAGAVYVFRRSGAAWIQEAYIKASNTDASDNFGFSVALSADGSTMAVGAYQEDSPATGVNSTNQANGAPDAGAVYVFTRSATTWSQHAYVKASNTNEGDNFGFRVALSGDGSILAVGAHGENGANNGLTDAGAVYVFARSGTTWIQQPILRASNAGPSDAFGVGVALSGDGSTLAVGANQEDGAATNTGAVYVFARSGTTWIQQPILRASNAGAADLLGFFVALSGDGSILAAGAHQEDGANNAVTDAGAVYVFARGGTGWSEQAYLQASVPGMTDQLGRSLTLSADGSTLAVGAQQEDSAAIGVGGDPADGSATDAGAVYVFRRSGATWGPPTYVKATNTEARDGFGGGLALSDDGSILAVGASGEDSAGGNQDDNSAANAGAVYVLAN